MIRAWSRFVAWMSQREAPWSLALVRVALCTVLLWDLALIGWYGLPVPLWAPREAGGMHDIYGFKTLPEIYWLLPPSAAEAWGATFAWSLWGAVVVTVAAFGLGVLTRFSGLLALLLYAQTAIIADISDRGIDRMIRIVFVILLLSGCGRALSVDAWIRTGTPLGDGRPILAFPRYLIVLQLTVMYFAAGLSKFALSWFPWGGYSALYLILQDPIFAVTDFGFLASPWLYWTTQLGTAVSHLWEITFPVFLLATWYRVTADRPGRLRHAFNTARVRLVYIVLGALFHVLLAATLRLGIFPAAMLALYPAFFHPDELRSAWRWLRRRVIPVPDRSPSPAKVTDGR